MNTTELNLIKVDIVDKVKNKVQELIKNKELTLPNDYMPHNAMKSAWLKLQDTKNKNGKPVLEVCTKNSTANALLDMVLQGLNPSKNQCYFVAYGNNLTLMRSYFGTVVAAKNAVPEIHDISFQVIYEDDDFEYEIRKGKKYVLKHIQAFDHIDIAKIKGAYCQIYNKEEKLLHCELMNMNQIKQVWQQGKFTDKSNPIDAKGNIKVGTTHKKFTDQMVLKSVINRACKYLINNSTDKSRVAEAYNRTLENEFVEIEPEEKPKRKISLEEPEEEVEQIDTIEELDMEEEVEKVEEIKKTKTKNKDK